MYTQEDYNQDKKFEERLLTHPVEIITQSAKTKKNISDVLFEKLRNVFDQGKWLIEALSTSKKAG